MKLLLVRLVTPTNVTFVLSDRVNVVLEPTLAVLSARFTSPAP